MNQPDPNADEFAESANAGLSGALRSLPMPTTPRAIEQQTRRRIGQRVFRQRVITAASVILLILSVVGIWQSRVPLPGPQSIDSALSISELSTLFAPPPVDPLAVLDRRQQVAYQALNKLEASR